MGGGLPEGFRERTRHPLSLPDVVRARLGGCCARASSIRSAAASIAGPTGAVWRKIPGLSGIPNQATRRPALHRVQSFGEQARLTFSYISRLPYLRNNWRILSSFRSMRLDS